MANRSDYYFTRKLIKGAGKMYFLKMPQLADSGSAPSKLLGSLVEEGDDGLIGQIEYPIPYNAYILEAVLDVMKNDMNIAAHQAINEISLANVSMTTKIDKKISGSGNAPFPGLPIGLGIEVNYKKLKSATIFFGEGTKKLLIPKDLLRKAYEYMADNSDQYDGVFFDDDRMVIDQVLIGKNISMEVESITDFSAGVDAKANAINDLNVGVKYSKLSERKYKYSLSGNKPYLIAVSGSQADKYVD